MPCSLLLRDVVNLDRGLSRVVVCAQTCWHLLVLPRILAGVLVKVLVIVLNISWKFLRSTPMIKPRLCGKRTYECLNNSAKNEDLFGLYIDPRNEPTKISNAATVSSNRSQPKTKR